MQSNVHWSAIYNSQYMKVTEKFIDQGMDKIRCGTYM